MTDEITGPRPQVKGASLLGFFKYVKEQKNGPELLEQIFSALPPASAESCRRKLIAVAAYPYSLFVDFIKTADRVIGRGDQAVCRQLGRHSAVQDIKFFKGAVNREVKPEDLLRATDIVWKSYHLHSGTLKTEDPSPEHCIVRLHDFPQMDPAHCRLVEGFLTQSLTEIGITWIEEVRETKCMSRGAPYHEFMGRWKDK